MNLNDQKYRISYFTNKQNKARNVFLGNYICNFSNPSNNLDTMISRENMTAIIFEVFMMRS